MNITVWNENVAEKRKSHLNELYPDGLHGVLADIVKDAADGGLVRTATLDSPDCGLPAGVLETTDVLLWWGHEAHNQVPDELVERIYEQVMKGMGLIVLHSGHDSKIFHRLMGTTCSLRWRDDTYERIFCTMPSHPIAAGIPPHFELGTEECYGEFFDVPQPDELIFTGWFDIGETFRSGCAWYRGFGKVFYFQPGHETNGSFHNPYVRRILQNACRWAAPVNRRENLGCPHISPTLEELRHSADQ